MVISGIATSKNHIELPRYWSPIRSETGFVILSKFWSRYDLQNFRKRNFLGDDQGELSKGTVVESSRRWKFPAWLMVDTI
jgi:hypothetical protein